MSNIALKEIQYKNYGKCLSISNGEAELLVTLDLGPRIISYRLANGENVFFEDTERSIKRGDRYVTGYYGEGAEWYIYGGHRLWISPEYPVTYYPDNGAVTYTVTGDGVEFTYGVQKKSGLLFTLVLRLEEQGSNVRVLHKIKNCSGNVMEFAPWALSVMAPGGFEIIPMNTHDTQLLSNRTLMLWPYTNMADERVLWGEKYISLKSRQDIGRAFKIGLDLQKGWVAYVNGGAIFLKRFRHYEGASYPDNGCSFETYTNHAFLEAETLGTTVSLPDGAETLHTEEWSLTGGIAFDGYRDEAAIEAFVERFIQL